MGKTQTKPNITMFVLNNKALLLMLMVAVLSVILTKGMSISAVNISGIARQISVSAIISIGITVLMAGGQLDLSVGEIVSLCGISYALLYHAGLSLPVIIILVLLIGMLCGFLNGGLTRLFKLPSLVLTLATAQIFKGITYLLTNGKTVGGLSDSMKYIGQGRLLGFLPVPFAIMIVLLIGVMFALNKTIYGRHVIATGGNSEAARVSGVSVNKIMISVYMVAGLCAAIASIVLTGRVASALPNAGDGIAMDAIAAVVIGGTPLRGGKANVIGSLFGVVLIGIINNMLNLVGISSFWQWVFKGGMIILAIVLDSVTDQFLKKQRESKQPTI